MILYSSGLQGCGPGTRQLVSVRIAIRSSILETVSHSFNRSTDGQDVVPVANIGQKEGPDVQATNSPRNA